MPLPAWRFRGWWQVALGFVVATIAWGVGFYGLAVLLPAIAKARDWPIASISVAISVHFLFSAALIARLDDWHHRFGLSVVTGSALVLCAAGALAWVFAPSPTWLMVAALVSGAGWAGTNSVAVNAVVSPWFDRRRGLALSLALNGASAGGIVLAPLWALSIEATDLVTAGVGMAVLLAVVAVPVAWGIRATPASSGQWVDNEPPRTPAAPASPSPGSGAPGVVEAPAPASRRALMADPPFRRVMIGFALALFAQVGLLTHMLARLVEAMPVAQAAVWVGAVSFSALVGRNLYGMVIGRLGARRVAVLGLSIQAAGVGLLAATDAFAGLALGCLLFGAGVGNLITLPPILLQEDYRGRTLARAVALAVAVNQAMFSLAPAAFGLMRDLMGGYGTVFALAAAMMSGSAVMLARPQAAPRP